MRAFCWANAVYDGQPAYCTGLDQYAGSWSLASFRELEEATAARLQSAWRQSLCLCKGCWLLAMKTLYSLMQLHHLLAGIAYLSSGRMQHCCPCNCLLTACRSGFDCCSNSGSGMRLLLGARDCRKAAIFMGRNLTMPAAASNDVVLATWGLN